MAEGVSFRVEDVLLERYGVVGVEEQVKVLDRLGEHERFHLVVALAARVVNVWQRGPARARRRVQLEGLKDLPPHVPPFGVARVVPHVEPGLDRLRPADVVRRVPRHHEVPPFDKLHILRRESCQREGIHLVACLTNRVGQRHVLAIVRTPILRSHRVHSARKACEVVHLVRESAAVEIGDVHKLPGLGALHELVGDSMHSTVEHLPQICLFLARDQPLLD
mmetsp:Transcript_45907/g.91582  ORF Transcript_45907/g.91582 Transcript_45907/m.91582 type:complete len:221 (+) Transcript_45907:284-946(+)